MKNIAIIPARSGSKGLKDKNIKLLEGKPLIGYTIEAAIESGLFDEIMVSTDSPVYAEIALKYGAKVPYLRSDNLSGDSISTWDVVKDVIEFYLNSDRSFDCITLLQPTSPLRTSEDIKQSFKMFTDRKARAVVAVCELDHSPLWSNTLPEDHSLEGFVSDKIINSQRQMLQTYYRINGAIYILSAEELQNGPNLYQKGCYAYLMDRQSSIDIDDELDFRIAECLIGYRNSQL